MVSRCASFYISPILFTYKTLQVILIPPISSPFELAPRQGLVNLKLRHQLEELKAIREQSYF